MQLVPPQQESLATSIGTMNDVLAQRAELMGKDPAFRFFRRAGDACETLTYSELLADARQTAALLRERNLSGQRVILFLEPGFDFLRAFFGCLWANAVAVPLPLPRPRRGLHRIQAVFADCKPTAILSTNAARDLILKSNDETVRNCPILTMDDVRAHVPSNRIPIEAKPDTLAFLQYTSGSTGTPKGVQVRHRNIVANVHAMADRLACTRDDIGVSWLPHFHDMGLIGGILLPLYAGFETILFPPVSFIEQPLTWLKTISTHRATISGGPNFAYELCARRATPQEIKQLDLSSWRLAFSGAEMVQPDVLDRFASRFAKARFSSTAWVPCYGLAEATLFVSSRPQNRPLRTCSVDRVALQEGKITFVDPSSDSAKKTVSCGPPAANHDIAIVASDGEARLGENLVGEVCITGPSITDGYWNRKHEVFESAASADFETLTPQRFLRTGDLGFIHDGELYITGRKKDVIILRGMNVYPDDIEASVEGSHSAIFRSGVAAFSVEKNSNEHAAVLLEIRRDQIRTVNLDEVFDSVRQAVADDLGIQLSVIVAVTQGRIPRTSSGKKQRRRCSELYLSESLEGVLGHWQSAAWNAGNQDAGKTPVSAQVRNPREAHQNVPDGDSQNRSWMANPSQRPLSFNLGAGRRAKNGLSSTDESSVAEPVAIVGMSCRLPGARNLDEFEHLLATGGNGISEVPSDRWDSQRLFSAQAAPGKMISRWGGFVDDISQFDADFFGITPREARKMDPQQRLLLESSWSALEHAGICATDLRGTQTGVFVGIGNSDYSTVNVLAGPAFREVDAYSGTGNAHSVAANRISFTFDLKGPSLAIDTACSSSLVALHYACQSLRAGECEVALVGGVNAILSPVVSIAFSSARMLSPDGQCYPFDARANGYVRSEGCGVVVLKPLSHARRDGDQILGVLRGTAVNHVGHSTGLTVPDAETQKEVIADALRQSRFTPDNLSYIEAHGTGTPVGDPIELSAITDVFRSAGLTQHPCVFGSVKGNLGHLETASGIASLIKVLLMLERKQIFPQANFESLNPKIDLSETRLSPARELTDWVGVNNIRRAGISSFGFGGTNAHVILEQAPAAKQNIASGEDRPVHLLTVAAHSETAFPKVADDYVQLLSSNSDTDVADLCYSANITRSRLPYRTILIAQDRETLTKGLRGLISRPLASGARDSATATETDRKLAFLCTGQGSQYPGMGHQLYQTQPEFRRLIEHCGEILAEHLDRPLTSILFPADEKNALINQTQYAQPAIFALEWSLAQLWMSWGLQPNVLLGHSVGEYVAACLAGVVSLEDGLKLIAIRGRLMGLLNNGGSMAAVMAAEKRVRPILEEYSDRVSLAALNGPRLTVISGQRTALEEIIARLSAENLSSKLLNVSEAFHSPLIEPMLDEFEQVAATIEFRAPKLPLISNVTGQLFRKNEIPDAAYWRRHARGAVHFEQGMKSLAEMGCNVFLEIGASPNLTSMGRTCISAGKTRWLPSLRPGQPDWNVMAKSLQSLHESGFEIDWQAFDREHGRRRVNLPEYPFQREHFWVDQTSSWYESGATGTIVHPLLGECLQKQQKHSLFQTRISLLTHEWLKGHRIFGSSVFPAAAFVEMGLAAARELAGDQHQVQLEDISFRRILNIPEDERVLLRLETQSEDAFRHQFQIFSKSDEESQTDWTLHSLGKVITRTATQSSGQINLQTIRERCPEKLDVSEFYPAVAEHGLEYSGPFQCLKSLWTGRSEAVAELDVAQATINNENESSLPTILDAGLQALGAAAAACSDTASTTFVPTHLGTVTQLTPLTGPIWVHARIASLNHNEASHSICGEVEFIDGQGNLCMQVRNVTLTAWGASTSTADDGDDTDAAETAASHHVTSWKLLDPLPHDSDRLLKSAGQTHWIILADEQGLGDAFARQLQESNQTYTVIHAGAVSEQLDEHSFVCAQDDQQFLTSILDTVGSDANEKHDLRIIHLWSLDANDLSESHTDQVSTLPWRTSKSLNCADHLLENGSERRLSALIVTRGGQVVNRDPEESSLVQSLTWGSTRAFGQAHPSVSTCLVDLDPQSHPQDAVDALLMEFLSTQGSHEVALRGLERYSPRLLPASDPAVSLEADNELPIPDHGANYRLEAATSNTIRGLRLESQQRRQPEPDEVEIQVEAAGVNFSDVLKSLGLYPHADDVVPLGLECCGIVTKIGEGVDTFQIGERVMALAPYSFSRYVTAPAYGVIRCPGELSPCEAAALPVAYATAIYSLNHLGRLRSGDRLLIHSASGGVGHAAIHLAQRAGAKIFATAGNEEKRAYLQTLGVEHVFDSRSDEFAEQILKRTDQQGVDIVLNSLGGELAATSLSVLRPFGRFIDLAKTDISQNPWLDRSRFQNNLAYFSVDLDQLYRAAPNVIEELMQEMSELIGDHNMPHSQTPLTEAKNAFRLMAQRRHIGKLVLTAPTADQTESTEFFDSSDTFLLAGELGPFALEFIAEMSRRGIRKFAALTNAETFARIESTSLPSMPKDVSLEWIDSAALTQSVADLRTAITSCSRSSAILYFAPGLNQPETDVDAGATDALEQLWKLHRAALDDSVAGMVMLHPFVLDGHRGTGIQAFCDALAVERWQFGRTGLSAGVGEIMDSDTAEWTSRVYTAIAEGLRQDVSHITIANLDSDHLAEEYPAGPPSLLKEICQSDASSTMMAGSATQSLGFQLRELPSDERQPFLLNHFLEMLARVTSQDASRIQPETSIRRLGLDSLMTMELKNSIESALSITVDLSVLFQDPTIGQLVDYALETWNVTNGSDTAALKASRSQNLNIEDRKIG